LLVVASAIPEALSCLAILLGGEETLEEAVLKLFGGGIGKLGYVVGSDLLLLLHH
jgi:hypothetical protein